MNAAVAAAMRVLIYKDYGSSLKSVDQLYKCLSELTKERKDYEIEFIGGDEIQNGKLAEKDANESCLCIGGGFDLGYMQSIGQNGCKNIREFVEAGGRYVGICAGAYFASNYIAFDMNGPLEVKGERWLRFFNGNAIGPVNRNFCYNSHDLSARAVRLNLLADNSVRYVHLDGGCYFQEINKSSYPVDIIGQYCVSKEEERESALDGSADKAIAVLETKIGSGVCLLSGIHFEFNPSDFHLQGEAQNKLEQEFKNYELARRLFSRVLTL